MGKVQGVGFRYFVYDNAIKLGLKGYVRNLNGGVEAVFDGSRENIDDVIRIIRTKHPTAMVKTVNVEVIEIEKRFEDFRLKH
ncbi:MAG: acylphosphatase [Candidatus Woesearchaeota archaeon]